MPLIEKVASAQHHPARIARPNVRKGWRTTARCAAALRREFRAGVVGHAIGIMSGELGALPDTGRSGVRRLLGWASARLGPPAQSRCTFSLPRRYVRHVNS